VSGLNCRRDEKKSRRKRKRTRRARATLEVSQLARGGRGRGSLLCLF